MTGQPTAAEVLRAHTNVGDYTCGCGWECTEDPRWVDIEAHQADMLAAAGLLVTPEHDAQVATRTLREAVEAANREWLRFRAMWGSGPTGLAAIDVLAKALAWLDERADRIERGVDT